MTAGMIIVGAGETGGRAALTLRTEGYAGPITLIGDEAHLPYERPPLSKGLTVGPRFIATEADYVAGNIRHIAGARAESIDRAAKTVTVRGHGTLPYDKLLLATGARPRTLAREDVLYLRNYDDAQLIRARLAPGTHLLLIGAGFIGLELAASARDLGATVTIVETQPRILMRGVPEEIAAVIASRHAAAGVTIHTGGPREIAADVVVAGIGSEPNTELAAAAGLAIDNGVAVDETLRTADPDIFAAGDCCSFPLPLYGSRRVRLESWRNAGEQGVLAARNMLGRNESVSAVPWFYSDQYDLGLQVAGLAHGATNTVRRDLAGNAFILFHLGADGTLLAASGIGPGNAVAKDIKLAELLIAKRTSPDPALLARADVKLKSLLAT